MHILTLGHQMVGKTTYMTTLHQTLQSPQQGFTLRAQDDDDRTRFYALATAILAGRYPPPTARRAAYSFALCYESKQLMSFSWTDYRGGLLMSSLSSDDDELARFRQDLKGVDGLMMLWDADELARGYMESGNLNRLVSILARALRDITHPISLAIVFTKTDLVKHFTEQMLQRFIPFFETISISEHVHGGLIPVACGPRTRNVPLPLLFALQTAVRYQAVDLTSQISAHTSVAALRQRESEGLPGVLNSLKVWLFGGSLNSALAEHEREQAATKSATLQRLSNSLLQIDRYVASIPRIAPRVSARTYASALNDMLG